MSTEHAQPATPAVPGPAARRVVLGSDDLHAGPPAKAAEESLGGRPTPLLRREPIRRHGGEGGRGDDAAAAVHQRTGEAQQVGGGGHEPAASIGEGRRRRPTAVGRLVEHDQSGVSAHEAERQPAGRGDEGAVGHPQRSEEPRAEQLVESPPCPGEHHTQHGVGQVIVPDGTRLLQQRKFGEASDPSVGRERNGRIGRADAQVPPAPRRPTSGSRPRTRSRSRSRSAWSADLRSSRAGRPARCPREAHRGDATRAGRRARAQSAPRGLRGGATPSARDGANAAAIGFVFELIRTRMSTAIGMSPSGAVMPAASEDIRPSCRAPTTAPDISPASTCGRIASSSASAFTPRSRQAARRELELERLVMSCRRRARVPGIRAVTGPRSPC